MIYTGDVREDMRKSLENVIEGVMGSKKNLESYYILIYSHIMDTNKIITKIVTMSRRPPKMLGTVCYHVDNKRGVKELLWLLPLDVPVPEFIQMDGPDNLIRLSAKDMPIVNS